MALKTRVQKLSQHEDEAFVLLQKELYQLEDMNYLYSEASTTQKQQLIRLVFDCSLYYKEGVYRTQYLMSTFSHNTLILKEKQLLVIDEKGGNLSVSPSGGAAGTTYTSILYFMEIPNKTSYIAHNSILHWV
jgi:hypothetical protein